MKWRSFPTICMLVSVMFGAILATMAFSAAPSDITDSESATHGDDAAKHQIVDTQRVIRLADRMSPDALRRLAKDLPGTFDLVDVRPAEHFADYSIPGSHNADIADVLANPAYLTGAGPLILVDRDGSLAMQVAGILSQKTQRTVKALHGGLEAYWKETVVKDTAMPSAAPSAAPTKPAGPAVTPPTGPQPAPPTPPKRTSAGC